MKFKVNMHCASCVINIERSLKKINVKCITNPALKITKIISNPDNRTEQEIIKAIEKVGYEAKSA